MLHIWRFRCFTHFLQKDAVRMGGGGGGGGRGGGGRSQFKSIQVHTSGGRVTECEYIRSLTIFLRFFYSLGNAQILQTLRVKIYTNRFQKLDRCCIHLQVFFALYQSNSGLWKSLNFIQLQAMAVLALNFRFVLEFDNSRIGAQFHNKLTLCKINIALLYPRYVYV